MTNKSKHDLNLLLGKLRRDRDDYKTLWIHETKKGEVAYRNAIEAKGAYIALQDILKWCEQFKIRSE